MLAHVQVDSNRTLNKCTLGTVRQHCNDLLFFFPLETDRGKRRVLYRSLLVLTSTVLAHSEQSDKIPVLSYGDDFQLERVVQGS